MAKRAPNPKRSWIFRVLPWKLTEALLWIAFIICVALLPFPWSRPFFVGGAAAVPLTVVPLLVLNLSGYYLSHPGPRAPKSRSVRTLVLLVPACLMLAFTTGAFWENVEIDRGASIQVSLKDQVQPIEGQLIFSITTRLLLRNPRGDLVVIPWEKVLSLSTGEKKP